MTSAKTLSLRFVVILVEPEDSINIGSVARAMSNLDFDELRLVSPCSYSFERAKISACWGAPVLESAKVFDDLKAAIGDCHELYGFSSQSGKGRIGMSDLFEWLPAIINESPEGTSADGIKIIGLLFGPESTGLRAHHWKDCVSLVSIPSSARNPSYNLAQACLLVLFEVRRVLGWGLSCDSPKHGCPKSNGSPETQRQARQATIGEISQLDSYISELGAAGGYLNANSPPEIQTLLAHLFRRIRPSYREVNILLGLFGGVAKRLRPSK